MDFKSNIRLVGVRVKQYQHDLYLGLCILLIAGIGYNIGRISALQKSPLTVGENANIYNTTKTTESKTIQQPSAPRDPRVVATKNSKSKVYHYSWCSGASRIKDVNKIWFTTENEAISAGYTLAGNCQ